MAECNHVSTPMEQNLKFTSVEGNEFEDETKYTQLVGSLIYLTISGYWWPPTYSNWLLLTVFSSTRFSVMMTFLCNCGFYTSGAILNPYTTSRWILVASHLFQLAYFGSFHVSTSFCTSRAILGP
jgi:hypothetical protein